MWLAISGFCFASLTFIIPTDTAGTIWCSIVPSIETYFNLTATFTTVIVAISIRDIFNAGFSKTDAKVNISLY
jgi:hypothetical protein